MSDAARPTGWGQIIALAIGLSVLVGALVAMFAWPAVNTEPREVPLVVAPAAAVDQVRQQLDQAMPGGFDLDGVDDAAAARAAIEDREAYGAIIVSPGGPPQVLTASAASPVVAQALTQLAAGIAQADGGASAPPVEDVVPLPDTDPRGAGFTAGALPMVMGGMATGIAMAFVVRGARRQVVGALVAAAGAGAVVVTVTQSWLEALGGDWWRNAGAVALTIAAIAVTLVGLNALLGRPGVGLGALLMFVVGNPLSGLASAPEMLPSGWGAFGQLLPPGAGGSLLRSTAFFDGAGAGRPLLVLGAWLVGGILLAVVGAGVRGRRTANAALSDATTSQGVPAVP